ncbi:helix-turn-helix domain-containing protein [Salipaludibacillus sp. CF4.18]|uniref:helix-turn-helix domain-containing protein n=1 Tax=Salipaludibacillus sp. CF4.18 TaxID=3373081 RepID=UPI003EE4C416
MDPVNQQIAWKLKQLRRSKGFSLEKTAEVTGVSKAMLGQIERGASNPTVSILWKIANGLKVSFSSFVEEEEPSVSIVHLSNVKPIIESNGSYQVFPIFPFKQDKQFEIYTVTLAENCMQESEAHQRGVEEYITVLEGELTLDINTNVYTVGEGDSIRFHADKPHVYMNKTAQILRFHNLIYYA